MSEQVEPDAFEPQTQRIHQNQALGTLEKVQITVCMR